jgi:outer membrane protein assembly factor BamB
LSRFNLDTTFIHALNKSGWIAMLRIWTPVFLVAMGCLTSPSAFGQDIDDRLVPFQLLNAQGFEREWDTHAQVASNYSKLEAGTLHVDSKKSLTQYVISYGNQREVIQETDIGPDGKEYGVLGASDAANLRVEILAAEGIEAQVTQNIVPTITMYVLSDQFVLQAIDAETGATRWATQVGTRNWPTSGIGVSDDHVCLTNGMSLFCLDADTGAILWKQRMDRTAGGGPLVTANFVYVPKVNGSLEVFSLNDPKRPSRQLFAYGRAMQTPILTSRNNVVWVSDRKALFVAPVGDDVKRFQFRVSFDRPISSNVCVGDNNTLIVGTDDGAIHCFDESRGTLIWKQFIPNPLRETPVAIGDDVFLVSLGPSLSVLSLDTGIEKWTCDDVARIVSVSEDHVMALDSVGRLVILDRLSGRRVSVIGEGGITFSISNTLTDRAYIGTRSGILQCVRAMDLPAPQLHLALDLQPNIPADAPEDKPTTRPAAPKPSDPADPFGGKPDDDPFGTGAAEDDPFGVK